MWIMTDKYWRWERHRSLLTFSGRTWVLLPLNSHSWGYSSSCLVWWLLYSCQVQLWCLIHSRSSTPSLSLTLVGLKTWECGVRCCTKVVLHWLFCSSMLSSSSFWISQVYTNLMTVTRNTRILCTSRQWSTWISICSSSQCWHFQQAMVNPFMTCS